MTHQHQDNPTTSTFKRVIRESAEMTESQRLERNAKFEGIVAERKARGLDASFNEVKPKTVILATGPVPGTTFGE